MLKKIPIQYKIIALLIAFSLYTLFIYNKGYSNAENAVKLQQAEAIREAVDAANERSKKDLDNALKYLAKQDQIDKKFQEVNTKLSESINIKPVYLNKDCVIDTQDVGILNTARKGKAK